MPRMRGWLLTVTLLAAALIAACSPVAPPAAAPTPTPSRLSAPALSPGMAHMMAALPDEDVPAATVTEGNQLLSFRLEDGVKVFELTAQPVRWTFMEGVQQVAWTYNGMVPGPMIRVTEGDRDWFTKPTIDSYHTVWFELHEDLLATLGLERSSERS